MCRAVKKTLLMLLEQAYYDTETHDDEFLGSAIHLNVATCVVDEII
jgi:hypothetical protein